MNAKARRKRLKVIDNLRAHDEHTGLGTEPFHDGYFTCDHCGSADVCRSAFDPYNTDGDCLEEKWCYARRTMNAADLEILQNTLNTKEKPPEFAVRLLEETCARTGLDWKLRHCYLIQRGGKWRVELSIDGFRLIGSQDESYGGQEGPLFTTGADKPWTDIPPENAPYASKVGIKHKDGTTTWAVAKFKDYATGPMWTKFPCTMIAKCAEMLAWRKAFPGRLGGLYGDDEMSQAAVGSKRKASDLRVETEAGNVAPKEAEEATDGLAHKFRVLLHGAKSRAEVIEVGKAISGNKDLTTDEVNELYKLYNMAKERTNE